ncbi:MAG: PorP/SprF family type IX secretion system membrane protein, partial [Bacteroidota bacterium]
MKRKNLFNRLQLLAVVLFLSVTVQISKAQDATFSQFYFNQLYVNPAFTGINSGLRVGVNYRALWPNIPSKFPTYSVAIDAQDLALSSGIGLHAWSDTEGEGYLRTQCISGLYSCRMILSPKNWVFQAGFQTSVINKKVDWSKLVFSDQLHPLFGITGPTGNPTPYQQSITFVDFTVGALIKGNQRNRIKNLIATYTFGVAGHHIVQPDESILGSGSRLPKNIVIHAGAVIPVRYEVKKYKILLVPNLLWEHQSTM